MHDTCLKTIVLFIIIIGILVSGCVDNLNEGSNKDKYGIQTIEIRINNPAKLNYSIIVPIAQSGLENDLEINNRFKVLEGAAIFSIYENKYGKGLLINSTETTFIKAESNEYVSIQPTMWKEGGYWFFLNCSYNLNISYNLYSFTSAHKNEKRFWIDNYQLHNGWNKIKLNVISESE